MQKFKLFGGEEIEDLAQYCRDHLAKFPHAVIHVGTDSKQLRHATLYVTVVCFYTTNGTHVIFKRWSIEKVKDLFTRLWNEIEASREIGQYIEEHLSDLKPEGLNVNLAELDLDINPDKKFNSNIVYNASVGYLTSLGFKVNPKPVSFSASYAADLLLK